MDLRGLKTPAGQKNQSDRGEPSGVDAHLFHLSGTHPKIQPFENRTESIPVDEIQDGGTIPCGFTLGFWCEAAGGDEEALISSAHHCPSQVADGGRSDTSLIALALEKHMEAEQGYP